MTRGMIACLMTLIGLTLVVVGWSIQRSYASDCRALEVQEEIKRVDTRVTVHEAEQKGLFEMILYRLEKIDERLQKGESK